LSDKAKEKARDWWLSGGMSDDFAWDNVTEDAKQIGLKLTGYDRGSMTGSLKYPEACAREIVANHGVRVYRRRETLRLLTLV
jgi:hypothetical protein